jgi:hypothetical protein
MARVVVRGGRLDADALGDRAGRARQGCRLLLVVALGDERGPEAHVFPVAHLGEEVTRGRRLTGQHVETQLVVHDARSYEHADAGASVPCAVRPAVSTASRRPAARRESAAAVPAFFALAT